MWRTLAAVALGVAGAMYVNAHRSFKPDPDDPGWSRLPNGLRVIVRPIEGATQAVVLTMFDIGANHDPDGRSGLAHLTEHLYVTSAAGNLPARTADEWLMKYGGRCDAETKQAYTFYFVSVPPGSMEAEIADAAARMSDLRIEASDLERERPRVLQQMAEREAAGTGSRPGAAGRRAAVDRILPPEIHGVPRDVEAVALDEVRERARRFYGPANARLVLTGAVDASAMRLVAKYFGGLPGGEHAPPATPRLTMNAGGRVDVDLGVGPPPMATERVVWIAWPGPSRDDPDSVAMLLLERRARSPEGDYRRQKFNPMSFLADGVVLLCWNGDEVPIDDVVKAADGLVARFVATPPTAAEVDYLAPRNVPGRDPYEYVAMAKFPEMLAFGLADDASRHRNPDRIRKALESLTKDDLARFAAKWLDPRNRVVAVARGPASPPLDEKDYPPWLKEVIDQAK